MLLLEGSSHLQMSPACIQLVYIVNTVQLEIVKQQLPYIGESEDLSGERAKGRKICRALNCIPCERVEVVIDVTTWTCCSYC